MNAPTAPPISKHVLIDPELWFDRSVLVTGHTGFKGAWLSLWLQSLGARVTGLAPAPPTDPSLYALARVGDRMAGELAIDVRDAPAVHDAVRETRQRSCCIWRPSRWCGCRCARRR